MSEALTDQEREWERAAEFWKERAIKLRAALVAVVGCDGLSGLDTLEAVTRLLPCPADDKAAMIAAIRALRETL